MYVDIRCRFLLSFFFFSFFFKENCQKCQNCQMLGFFFANIRNQYEKCIKLRTNKPMFGSVVFHRELGIFYKEEISFSLKTVVSSMKTINSLLAKYRWRLYFFTKFQKFQNRKIFCPYLESVWKMDQNEYKHAYVWSSGSWDSLWYFHKQDVIFPLNNANSVSVIVKSVHFFEIQIKCIRWHG